MTETRGVTPTDYLNYKGDQRGLIGKVLGPGHYDEFYFVVEAKYDDTANKTRVGLVISNQ